MIGWQDKVKRMIEAEAWRCYRVANTKKDGKLRKRHIPYTLPSWVNDEYQERWQAAQATHSVYAT